MSFDVLSNLNYLAVAVAALAYFIVGALWYSPVLFAKTWQKATGLSQEQMRSPGPKLFVGTYVAYFVAALTLAAIAGHTGATSFGQGIVLGLFTGVGIVSAMIWVGHAYEQRPSKLTLINAGNAILGFVVMSVIVTIWD